MSNIPEHGYTVYPQVPTDQEFPGGGAPEKQVPERSGDDESWKGGPIGLQPGFDLPGISPMVPGFYELFGPWPNS